ncbi:thioredoxin-related transmembrane protein 4 isoform X2 [Esox lucius]|uniref:thioredoxin-related transmembrane protein 4 isoform X2 n=1 Tax=Esox lucius TaxID=8010 RepID=UPI0005767AF1|nr:thioredoxin-related transmembrane protein 4 isoform X2 [Esox lucius]
MAQLKTKRSCKLSCIIYSTSCKSSRSKLFPSLMCLLMILISYIAGSVAETETSVLTIADANWTVTMDGEWMIKFVAPWCPACAQLKEQWERFSHLAAAMGVSVGEVDVTQQPGLSGRFLVTTLPTIFHAKEGSVRRYVSVREVEEFRAYIANRKWEEVEPLPSWKSPSSPLMSCMAGLFRLSLWIRTHGYLTRDLGMPPWGSYLFFAIATLVTGLLMGLVLVLLADGICPSQPKGKREKADLCVRIAKEKQPSEADEGEVSNKEEPQTPRQRKKETPQTS